MKKILSLCLFCCFGAANAATFNFEDVPDLTLVNEFYSAQGIHFTNAISLTAGFSLNEFDYPPSSGDVAIGDDFAPIEITFDNAVEDLSAYFTYGSQLTFTAFDTSGGFLGSFINLGFDNLGSSELISLSFSGIGALKIAGDIDGTFIMDDLSYSLSPTSTVPAPSVLFLMLSGLISLIFAKKKEA